MLEHVNKELVPMKAHYFLYNAATGPIVPFLPTIAKQLGFSSSLVGTIYTILPISGLIAKPLFGGLADKFRLHKTIFLIFQVILAIGFFTINFIPEIESSAEVTFTCDRGISFIEVCSTKGFSPKITYDALNSITLYSNCQLSCNITNNTYNESCSKPNATQFCQLIRTNVIEGTTFNFTVGFNMYQNLPTGNCVNVRVLNMTFSESVVHAPACSFNLRTSCMASCRNNPIMNHLLEEVRNGRNVSQTSTYQFHLFLWAAIVSWVGMAVVVSIADAICCALLGDENRKDYGKQKMWGSIGFGIFGISAGYLIDVFSRGQSQKDYTCIFYIMLIAMILDIIVSFTIKKKNIEYSKGDPSVLWELLSVGKEGRVLVFGWWCIGAGMCTGVVWNFLFWYTEDIATHSEAAWIKTVQGLLTGVQCFLGELPFNFISGAVLRKLGHVNVMSFVLLIYAARFMAYSMVRNLWVFLPLEILHGPTLGLCWPTMVSYADKVAPSGMRATMQGFVGAVFEGVGVSAGSLLCGWLMNVYGGVVTFRIFSIGALIWLAIYWILQLLLQKAKASPIHQGHNHLASYATPDDAILLTMNQELQTY
ncbi:major facilitator superfamily domain-containing protein 6 isoform X2 [Cephus cinctus]|uniref:Major facilitator superfamily domain-containing protein 6 isoform X2 n=1 Tax=Cephus cinctus TaxID=211228 RepID=A0AAJ7FTN0_CEPCN|nr:major facilitator superfamily domain-containing protein 6 isoform X2 [Cephus cinctus]